MFTHHELLLLQTTERQLEVAAEARQGRLVAALRRAKRAARPARPARNGARGGTAAQRRPAGTLVAWAAGGGPTR